MAARIGITTSYDGNEQQLRYDYVRAVEGAGGVPVIVPMIEREAAFRTLIDTLDGLVVTGGPAITEGLVGTLPAEIAPTDPLRLRTDRRLLQACLDTRKPVLGICYGMQLVNALAGGTIYADVERQVEDAVPHSEKRGATAHPIRLLDGTHLYRILGTPEMTVNTRHLQAVAAVGDGLRVAARAPDGVIEALENEDGSVLGVQFHPERMKRPMQPLFHHLVSQVNHASISETPPPL